MRAWTTNYILIHNDTPNATDLLVENENMRPYLLDV